MKPIFDEAYMKKRQYLMWRSNVICPAIIKTFQPTFVVDVGCAVGDIVQGLLERDIQAVGIDSSKSVLKFFAATPRNVIIADVLNSEIANVAQGDLVICFEVFSVIDEADYEKLVETLSKVSTKYILAGLHQEVRPKILALFSARGWVEDKVLANKFREEIGKWKSKPAVKAYHTSACLLKKR